MQSDAHLQKGSKRENGRIIKTIRNTEALAWSSAAVCFFDLKIKDEICVCPAKATSMSGPDVLENALVQLVVALPYLNGQK